ncbi:MAG: 4-hydroxy-3-methylbut-2-enyl diphosphate reductase [Alphaproteobacteria bacterium]|nr:4-hydroxy-3-methylbut-2-enyl diphosphate reductase [Alphaproteobacteria bacterium]
MQVQPSTIISPVDPPEALNRHRLEVRLASPRGFCAGVERAIRIVEDAISAYGPPVYVRHEIVHNAHVVNRLRAMGAVFVDELDDAPREFPTIISAHGAASNVFDDAARRGTLLVDATCPLVLKVHNETRRRVAEGRHVVLIGHDGHPEVAGIVGQTPSGTVSIVQTVDDAAGFQLPDGAAPDNIAYVTQTTLSVDETADIIAVLTSRFPAIKGPNRADICYATSNRQAAVKKVAPGCDMFIVVGDKASSNSNRLVETAISAGAAKAALIPDPDEFDLAELHGIEVIGVTSGASAPEELVERLIARIAESSAIDLKRIAVAEENFVFRQPKLPALS